MLPNFLIVGGMKCGTSAFAYYLDEHPEVFLSPKELHFFNSEASFKAGIVNYEAHFRAHNGAKAVGEKTPSYSYHPLAAKRIAGALPDVKLIWILRNPSERAYSHYWFFVAMGKERLSFDRAIEREKERVTRDYTMAYRDRSVYSKQVKNYLDYFSRDQMLFLLWEDLKTDAVGVLSRTCDFLGVSPEFCFTRIGAERNVTHRPRIALLQWPSYKLFSRRGSRVLSVVQRLNREPTSGYPPMADSTRASLDEYFEPHNRELADLTGLDLSAWNRKWGGSFEQ
jgi:hypothetical protein